jgi:hypothetical protein
VEKAAWFTLNPFMHAHDRFLPEWFTRIESRQITLPRFQRMVAWGHTEVAGLLTTVLRGLPSGATLILEVGDEEKFPSRTVMDAPDHGGKVTEQLLDGQQRLTALWRALHDKFLDRTYLIGFEDDPHAAAEKLPAVYGQARWLNKDGKRYPVWVDSPRECLKRSLIPIKLLRPADMGKEISQWINEAITVDEPDRLAAYMKLSDIIQDLRTKVREFNLPYLALPAKTPRDVALDVFIKMNTSSVKLSTYDIVVALVEEGTGKSLHEHVDLLAKGVPRAVEYADLPGLVLDFVALYQDRTPSQAGYQGIDFSRMIDSWDEVVTGIKGMVRFLEEESIYDAARLPSYTAIPIIAALWNFLPTQADALGNARHLLRKFLWRAFLSARYEQSSASNALQDYRALKTVLIGKGAESTVPVFNEEVYPMPVEGRLMQADWPKGKTILGRALLALQIKCGAEDLADGQRANVATITSKEHPREYHHLFPASLLERAGLASEQIFRALNCALITWRTNRTISDKDPLKYLQERADNNVLGEEDLRRRLKTHLIPFGQLAVGNYDTVPSESERSALVKFDYDKFLLARAELLSKAVRCAWNGEDWSLHDIYGSGGSTANAAAESITCAVT